MNNSNILHIVTEYKNKIMQLLISNENYRKLLSPEKSKCEELDEVDVIRGGEWIINEKKWTEQGHVFDHDFVDDAIKEKKVFTFVDANISSITNNMFIDFDLYIFPFVDKDLIRLSEYSSPTAKEVKNMGYYATSTYANRIDAMCECIESIMSNTDEAKRAFKQIGQFAMTYGLIQNTVMQIPSQMISAVKDYDSAMTNMQMATGISNNQAQELMNTYSDMGKQLKVTGVDVATSATEWMKQGKTIEESNKLAQDSIVLSKIGDLSSDDATRTITAAMKSYDLNESQVMDFVDQISAIDMASGTDVGGLANAFNEVAANANQAGISTKQLLSYAAVIGETTQEGMSSVGTSLNAIFSRMGNIKLSRLKDYQNGGEDLSNVETVLKGVGISLRDTDGEFKNFGDVLDDTAARWSDFGTVQQRAVAQAFAGTNHMNDFMVLMQQYSKAQEYMQTASDASGTSMEKYGAYTDSFEGKLEGLKSTFESLSNTVVNSDFLKGTIDTGTQALEIFDKVTNSLGVINTAAIGLGIFQGKNNSGESTWDSPHAFFKTTYAA